MPEYLAPGVYVEETSFRSKSIEGVSTTTTGFIGPCRYGPLDIEPDIITSLGEFERIYGDRGRNSQSEGDNERAGPMHNCLWHAVAHSSRKAASGYTSFACLQPIARNELAMARCPPQRLR